MLSSLGRLLLPLSAKQIGSSAALLHLVLEPALLRGSISCARIPYCSYRILPPPVRCMPTVLPPAPFEPETQDPQCRTRRSVEPHTAPQTNQIHWTLGVGVRPVPHWKWLQFQDRFGTLGIQGHNDSNPLQRPTGRSPLSYQSPAALPS